MGNLVMEMGDLDEAIACYRHSVEIGSELVQAAPDDFSAWLGLTEGRISLGALYRVKPRLNDAENEYKKALDVPDRLLQSHPDEPGIRHLLAACHTNLANLYRDTTRAAL